MGKGAKIGDVRNWGGVDYIKTKTKTDWVPMKNNHGVQKEKIEEMSTVDESKIVDASPTPISELGKYSTVITFSSQKLLNLWKNEMSGQISDGQWGNSSNTEWIWNSGTRLGSETKVETVFHGTKKTTFPFSRELQEIVGERATEEAGFRDLKETKSAWDEINNAIKNQSYSKELQDIKIKYSVEEKRQKNIRVASIYAELDSLGFDNQYSFASHLKMNISGLDKGLQFEVNPSSITKQGKIKMKVFSYSHTQSIPKIEVIVHKADLVKFIKNTKDYITNLVKI